jgi:hypothetical protein
MLLEMLATVSWIPTWAQDGALHYNAVKQTNISIKITFDIFKFFCINSQ